MNAIKDLQEGASKPRVRFGSAQTVEISVGPVTPETKPTELTSRPDTVKPSEDISPSTQVYAVWLDHDGLVYEVR